MSSDVMPGGLRRPAEAQLVLQFKEERNSLLEGFEDRKAVLRWGQRIAVRTLGQIPQQRFHELAKSYIPDDEYLEGELLAAFLKPGARTRDMGDTAARQVRGRWASDVLGAVQVRAFRDLRKDAGRYVGDSDDDVGYDPETQEFAMRPALSELDNFQSNALEMALDGLDDQEHILEWGDALTNATRGEPIDPDRPPGSFIPWVYRNPSLVTLLTTNTPAYTRARQAFLAQILLPAFNRGVRDLTGRAAEEPVNSDDDYDDNPGGWT